MGDTKHELNRIAIEGKYSLFVVGSRGYSLVGEAFLGGVANDVMHHAYMPVLLLLINWPCGLDGGLLAYVFFQGCSTGARAKMACNELASAGFKAKFLRMNIKELVVALQTEQLKGKSVFKQSEAATR